MSAESNIIDREALNGLLDAVGGDSEFLRELLDEYFKDSPVQFNNMTTALSSNNAEDFRRAAHSLKSNSANFGALDLSLRFKQLEDLGKSGNLDGGEALVAQANAKYLQVKTALEAILQELS
jgi:HPt (histidine-containing phosphotransfer) domain-containing protein